MRLRNYLVIAILVGGCGAQPPSTSPSPPKAAAPPAPVVATTPPPKAPPVAPKAAPPAPAKAPAPAKTPAPAVAAAPPAAARPAPPSLDLKSLEQRLKETDAIGVLTKLSLKNQVDDLVARFRAFHGGQRPPTLTELRPAFDLLLMKVLALLQDKDGALAKDINVSRESIWGVLADRDKFSKST